MYENNRYLKSTGRAWKNMFRWLFTYKFWGNGGVLIEQCIGSIRLFRNHNQCHSKSNVLVYLTAPHFPWWLLTFEVDGKEKYRLLCFRYFFVIFCLLRFYGNKSYAYRYRHRYFRNLCIMMYYYQSLWQSW